MSKRSLQRLLKLTVFTSAAVLTMSVRADLQERHNDQQLARQERDDNDHRRHDDDDDRDEARGERRELVRLPTGQFVTPTAIDDDAFQQYLNPGLPGYPNFIAGEAVRSQLSPDGSTLAVLTAGQNSLYKPDGTVDVANSTQYLFLYNVEGANKARPRSRRSSSR